MKRRHSRDDALAIVAKLRALRPDMVVRRRHNCRLPPPRPMRCFENTHRIVTEADLTYLHVFPLFAAPKARLQQECRRLAASLLAPRAARLRAVGERQFARLCESRVGRIENVLVERNARAEPNSSCRSPWRRATGRAPGRSDRRHRHRKPPGRGAQGSGLIWARPVVRQARHEGYFSLSHPVDPHPELVEAQGRGTV